MTRHGIQPVPMAAFPIAVPYPKPQYQWDEDEVKMWCASHVGLGKEIRSEAGFSGKLRWREGRHGHINMQALRRDIQNFIALAYVGRRSTFRLTETDRVEFAQKAPALISKWQEAFNIPSSPSEGSSPLFTQLMWNRVIAVKSSQRRAPTRARRERQARSPRSMPPEGRLDNVYDKHRDTESPVSPPSPARSPREPSCDETDRTDDRRPDPSLDRHTSYDVDTMEMGADGRRFHMRVCPNITDTILSELKECEYMSAVVNEIVDGLWRCTHDEEGLVPGQVVRDHMRFLFESKPTGPCASIKRVVEKVLADFWNAFKLVKLGDCSSASERWEVGIPVHIGATSNKGLVLQIGRGAHTNGQANLQLRVVSG